jgi:DNA-binding transcriptional LysR family regulator
MDPLRDIALFVAIARDKSFSKAAKTLDMSVSSVSRRLADMEAALGVQLVKRTTRHVELTEAGAAHYERCRPILEAADAAYEALGVAVEKPRGTVRVAATPDFISLYIAPLLPEFVALYPDVTFRFDLSPRWTDLFTEDADIALRIGAVHDSRPIARRMGHVRSGLYASENYLRRVGHPAHPSELRRHECLFIAPVLSEGASWTLVRGEEKVQVSVAGRFGVNNMSMIRQLAALDLGVGIIDVKLAQELVNERKLTRVLPEWSLEPQPVFALTATRLLPGRTRIFLEFLTTRIDLEGRSKKPKIA